MFESGTGCGILSVSGPTHLLLEHQEQRLELSSLDSLQASRQNSIKILLEKLTSKEVAKEVFDSLEKNTYKCVSSINAGFTARFVKRLHLDPLLWLLERGVFETELARNLKVVVARMNEENSSNGAERGSRSGEDYDESDVETVQEPVERAAEDSDKEVEQDTALPK